MMKRVVVFLMGISLCCACGDAERASGDDSVAGTYVREYSKEILNQLNGNRVGMRTVRDTLLITSVGDSYQIQNFKWRMNDYDNEGWQDMKHGEAGPMPTFKAAYDKKNGTLNSKSPRVTPTLTLADGKLSVGKTSDIAYSKID
jgi:hypothetical protein